MAEHDRVLHHNLEAMATVLSRNDGARYRYKYRSNRFGSDPFMMQWSTLSSAGRAKIRTASIRKVFELIPLDQLDWLSREDYLASKPDGTEDWTEAAELLQSMGGIEPGPDGPRLTDEARKILIDVAFMRGLAEDQTNDESAAE
jgi:hypothetical protein